MTLRTITITGADDHVNPEDLAFLSEKYPFVEWGILLSETRKGTNRFPSSFWMERLKKYKDQLRLSGHLCGRWLGDMMKTGTNSFKQENPDLWALFKRIQLNFLGNTTEYTQDFLDSLSWSPRKQFIFQVNSFDNELLIKCKNSGLNVVPLFDLSHGGGITPSDWPSATNQDYYGFAGGLGPSNLKEEIERILSQNKDINFWVDMETNVRDNDNKFDLLKVEKCLDIAEEYISRDNFTSSYLETIVAEERINDSIRPPKK